MNEGDYVTKRLNAFNTMISQLFSMDIKIIKEEKCISLLRSLPNSWDSLVVATRRNTTTLRIDDVVASLLSEEMIWKNMEGFAHDTLMLRN